MKILIFLLVVSISKNVLSAQDSIESEASFERPPKIPIIGNIPIVGSKIEEAARPISESLQLAAGGAQLAAEVIKLSIPTPKTRTVKIQFEVPDLVETIRG